MFELGLQQYFHSQLPECYVKAEAATFAELELVYFNKCYAASLDAHFPKDAQHLARLFSGQNIPDDAKPIAQAYAGHQFGHFNPQLGDGRAMILGELLAIDSSVHELDLKGSGPTPFSRGGDGKAALGPMLREVLIAEAMHALGVPTTRALAVVTTSETVYRNPPQPGAVLARTAESHIRIGTFQFFAAREQYDVVEKLVSFCLKRHYSNRDTSASNQNNISEQTVGLTSRLISKNSADERSTNTPAFYLLRLSIEAQAKLIAKWMGLGFIHGVMNTDNMLIGAQTIDYGPCAFMDVYEPNTVFSSIDQNSRYAYSNQPGVAQWNLSRFAETLLPLIHDNKEQAIELATKAVQDFIPQYEHYFRQEMAKKLGLATPKECATDINQQLTNQQDTDALIEQWLDILHKQKVDWTNAHFQLTCLLHGKKHEHQNDASEGNEKVFFELFEELDTVKAWLKNRAQFNEKLSAQGQDTCEPIKSMLSANPAIIPRNHLVEEALQAATHTGDLGLFNALLTHLTRPFDKPTDAKYTQMGSDEFYQSFRTFCGT